MFFRFIRITAATGLIYLLLRVGYPVEGHQIFHMLAVLAILTAATVVTVALQLMEFASVKLPLILEAAFAAAVFVVLGFTMPSKRGPILPQILEGRLPTQSSVREGLARLGLDPKSDASKRIIAVFPK
ncbi:MAG: hypothetical protein HY748_01320 [Elusimicrobia bacterium]|nr:hypothetical protein [Elusimicrobiota bacterium]